MHDRKGLASVWDSASAFSFSVSVCFVCWSLSLAASYAPNFAITMPGRRLVVDSDFILLTAATFLPALYCFVAIPQCRTSLLKVDSSWKVYLIAIFTGLSLPFLSYIGTDFHTPPWGKDAAKHLGRVFASNFLLAPFWEEIVWRGCFLKKIGSFASAPSGILLMSIGWTIWHGGYISFLFSRGTPVPALIVLGFTYFFIGVVLGSVFVLGRGSLWPCVLLHALLNSSTAVYYSEFNRASELGSYISELVFAIIAAVILFILASRRNRSSYPRDHCAPDSPSQSDDWNTPH